MLFEFLFVILTMNTDKSEAHVFCQDIHATPWTPLGYSCPVNCASIVETVRRLSEKDYETIFTMQNTIVQYNNNITELYDRMEYNDIDKRALNGEFRRRNHKHREPNKDVQPHFELYKVLNNKKAAEELQNIFTTASKYMKRQSCDKILTTKKLKKIPKKAFKICARRSDIQGIFFKKFTNILNKYTRPDYVFTVPLITKLLEKILSSSLKLLDVKMILKHLRQIILNSYNQLREDRNSIIKLKSKFCLNVYIPGCFCIPGLVENQGQCVKPAGCFQDPSTIDDYLARIIVQ